jgi:RHS repeat-associated protein
MTYPSGGISIPSGGGALKGIGETFQPDLHTGTANLSVPIPLPPGRGSLTPTLTLAYSSGAGNGPFGLGWSLAVPRVSRRTDRGVPRYDDTADVFVLSGAEELAPVALGAAAPDDLPGGATAIRYRPRTESGFARIVHVTGAGNDYWDVWSRDGLRSRYGTQAPADAATAGWSDPAVITRPGGGIFSWLITRTSDSFGSHIAYEYRDDGTGSPQRYLQTVSYADYGDPSQPSYAVTATVSYALPGDPGGDSTPAARPDPFSDRRPGFELRTTLRASQISVTTLASDATAATGPATTVDLTYRDETTDGPVASLVSLLAEVTVTGLAPGADPQPLPPLTFTYRDWDPAQRRYRPLPGLLPPVPLGGAFDLVDLFTDGLPSVIELDGAARYWRNLGSATIERARPLNAVPAGATLGSPGVLLSDVDGDGRPELAVTVGGRTTVWSLATGDGNPPGFDPQPRFTTAVPSVGYTSSQVRLIDLDGDHIDDLLVGGSPPMAATGDGQGGFSALHPLPGAPPPLTDLTDPHVHLADFTGDGLTDIALIYDGALTYWPSLGFGQYGPPVRMTGAPQFADALADPGVGYDPARLIIGDVTGDGTADVVYVADASVTVWLNQSGNGFAPPVTVHGTPRMASIVSVRLADFDGIGVSGLLWSGIGTAGTWAFLDLTGGVKPYLMTGTDNHRGAITTWTWSTSTAYAAADRTAGQPWTTTLPFPVHVVAQTQTQDIFAQTTLTTTFAYHDGYWDPADREFRGFRRVEQTDALTPATPPAAPATVQPLDPLTPRYTVPAGFDPAGAGNLLANWSFDAPGTAPTTLTTTADQPAAGGASAAPGWGTWNNTAATTTTELVATSQVPAQLPQAVGGTALHVTTDDDGCGITQVFTAPDGPPDRTLTSVWLYLVRGSVAVGTGPGGSTGRDIICDQIGQWVLVQAVNGGSPADELIIYAAGDDGAEFYADHAWVTVLDVPLVPVDSPPTRTITWFHLGPVGPASGDWTDSGALTADYWPGDPPLQPYLDQTAIPGAAHTPQGREALRGLRGRILRTELYADDGDPDYAARPYEVHESAFTVQPVIDPTGPAGPGDPAWLTAWLADPVVTVYEVLTRSTVWDRGSDPMTRITANGNYDSYGRPQASIELGVPRGRDPRQPGAPCLAAVTFTSYATRDDTAMYRIDRTASTTRYEAVDPGTGAVTDFATSALNGDANGELRAMQFTYYDGDAFTGLALGQLGDHALPARAEHLVITGDQLEKITQPAIAGATAGTLPPYLDPTGAAPTSQDWPGYPAAFQQAVTGPDVPASRGTQLGYTWHDAAAPYAAGYYAQSGRVTYDLQSEVPGPVPRGLVVVSRDAYGGDTTTAWDDLALLPAQVTDPAGLTTSAVNDYRVLKPVQVTDPNGNITSISYTPLGLPAQIARLGKNDGTEGDTDSQPSQTFGYNLTAYDESIAADPANPQPMSVTTVRRVDHRWTLVNEANAARAADGQPPLTDAEIAEMFDPDTEPEEHPERFIHTVEFTDGMGRLLQTRTQADNVTVSTTGLPADTSAPANTVAADPVAPDTDPRVIVSGWKVYDNKGRPVLTYEPFFAAGYGYDLPGPDVLTTLAAAIQHYDPRGRPTVTIAPDGSQTRIIYGTPTLENNPATVIPNPWETYTYDANDNAGRTHPTLTLELAAQWNTPSSTLVDALGRTIQTIQRGLADDVTTTSSYDIDGHLTAVVDPLGRPCLANVYDSTGTAWLSWLLDAGSTRTFHDAVGAVAERRDDKDSVTLTGFDNAHRAVQLWAGDRPGQTPTLRQVTVYGDDIADSGLSAAQAAAANANGRAVTSYDEAGRIAIGGYDLDGNPLNTTRQILQPTLIMQAPDAGQWTASAYAVDWQPAAGETLTGHASTLLDNTEYRTDATFDALGRRSTSTAPLDNTGSRAVITFGYSRGGGITRLTLDGAPYLQQVTYDPHGRRNLAQLGNSILLRYLYDPNTFRLRRCHMQPATQTATMTQPDGTTTATAWQTSGTAVQDHTYRYDLAGNLLTIGDRTPGSGLPVGVDPIHSPDQNTLNRVFGYDALNRLLTATGRETDIVSTQPWDDNPRSVDVTKARAYTETYTYDTVGNLSAIDHDTNTAGTGAYTRIYTLAPDSNQLTSMSVSGDLTGAYTYDAAGNLTEETTTRHFEWDHANQLTTFRVQTGNATPSKYAQYRYDTTGERAIKIVRTGAAQDETTIYVGGFERSLVGSITGQLTPYDEIHLTDRGTHLAMIQRGAPHPADGITDQPVRYQASDHLASVLTTLDPAGIILNTEEYLPYGETSFGSYQRKRYRHTSKERDSETGLDYHSARYYAPWLARWVTTDPSGHADGWSLYLYCRANPVIGSDPGGHASQTSPDLSGTANHDAPGGSTGPVAPTHPQDIGDTTTSASPPESRRSEETPDGASEKNLQDLRDCWNHGCFVGPDSQKGKATERQIASMQHVCDATGICDFDGLRYISGPERIHEVWEKISSWINALAGIAPGVAGAIARAGDSAREPSEAETVVPFPENVNELARDAAVGSSRPKPHEQNAAVSTMIQTGVTLTRPETATPDFVDAHGKSLDIVGGNIPFDKFNKQWQQFTFQIDRHADLYDYVGVSTEGLTPNQEIQVLQHVRSLGQPQIYVVPPLPSGRR